MSQVLIIRKLQVQGANAISSPFTYGFPAVTAFLGFGHALQRHFNSSVEQPRLNVRGVGIISHKVQMLDESIGYNRLLKLTGNPLNEHGERSSFVEEGRCHMTVSLVLEVDGLTRGTIDTELMQDVILSRMKLAGGDILTKPDIQLIGQDKPFASLVMPGYALMERRSLIADSMKEGADALTAIHRYVAIQNRSQISTDGSVVWSRKREKAGWLVPIATGFHAISEIQHPKNTREPDTPHRFAESVVTLGEFVLASRIKRLSEILWRYQHSQDLYLCVQSAS